ncbi:yeats-domain-containing protein, partial [Neoconidiobolus thromboides FSU 785]
DVCFYIPFVYGSQAIPLSAKEKSEAPENHTHRWTVFVRGVNGEDLSFMLRRVTFRLHDTYDNNNRSVEKYPFEVTETGWGEFEIVIKLLFTLACNEKLITLYHNLRLYPLDDVSNTTWSRGKVVHSFHYDELVFNEPYEAFYQTYLKQPTITLPAKKTPAQPYSKTYFYKSVYIHL